MYYDFWFLGKKHIGCNFSLGQFSWGVVFLGAICPRGNYVDDKSSERQFSSRAISKEILPGSNYLWSNCPGAIIQDQSSREQLSWGQLSSGAIIREAIFIRSNCLGGNHPGGNCPGDNYLEAIFLGSNCTDTIYVYICIINIFVYMLYTYIYILYIHIIIYIYMKIAGWKSKTEYQGLHTWSSSCYFHTWIIQFTRLLHTVSFTHI